MNNGLDITEDEFMSMTAKNQRLVLFRNAVHGRKKDKDYTLNKKFQYIWLLVLTIALGFRKYLPL